MSSETPTRVRSEAREIADPEQLLELEERLDELEHKLNKLALIVKSAISDLAFNAYKERGLRAWLEERLKDRREDIIKLLEETEEVD